MEKQRQYTEAVAAACRIVCRDGGGAKGMQRWRRRHVQTRWLGADAVVGECTEAAAAKAAAVLFPIYGFQRRAATVYNDYSSSLWRWCTAGRGRWM